MESSAEVGFMGWRLVKEGGSEWADTHNDTIMLVVCLHGIKKSKMEGRDRDVKREGKNTRRWKKMMSDEKKKRRWKIANLPITSLSLSFNCYDYSLSHSLSLYILSSSNFCPHFSLRLSAEADTGRALPAGSSDVCGGGLAVSNEIPLVRFQTSTASFAFSNTSTKWYMGRGQTQKGRDGGIIKKV